MFKFSWLRLSTLCIVLRDCLLQRTQFRVYLEKKVRVATYFKIHRMNKKKFTMFFEFCPSIQLVCFSLVVKFVSVKHCIQDSPHKSEFTKKRSNSVSNLVSAPIPFNTAVVCLNKECLSFEIHAK